MSLLVFTGKICRLSLPGLMNHNFQLGLTIAFFCLQYFISVEIQVIQVFIRQGFQDFFSCKKICIFSKINEKGGF
jgi:hypothetical protein